MISSVLTNKDNHIEGLRLRYKISIGFLTFKLFQLGHVF